MAFTKIAAAGIDTSGTITTQSISVSGVSTVGSLSIGATSVISSARQLQNIASLDATTTATIESAVANAPNTFTDLSVSGISTLGVTSATNLTAQSLNVSGIITATQLSTGASGTGVNISTDTISGPATLTIDPAAVGDNTGAVRIKGDLYVDGTQFIVNSTTIELADFNVGIASTVGTNALLDGAGIGIGSIGIRKTLTWNNSSTALKSSEDFDISSGKVYRVNGTSVLSNNTLGSGVVTSSLTSVGTLGQLQVTGVSTFTNGPVFIGTASSTGTASQRLQVTGGAYVSGNLGIGVTSPSYKLDIDNTGGSTATARVVGNDQANVRLRIQNIGSGGRAYEIVGGLNGANNSHLSVYDATAAATRLTITDTGLLGVGTASPIFLTDILSGTPNTGANVNNPSQLSVTGPNKTLIGGGATFFVNSNSDFAIDNGGSIALSGRNTTSSTNSVVWGVVKGAKENATSTNTAGYLAFASQNHNAGALVEAMRIDSSGRFLVGTVTSINSESIIQTVGNSQRNISLKYSGTAGGAETLINFVDKRDVVNASIGNNLQDDGIGTAAAHLVFKTAIAGALTERMRIDSAGRVTMPYQPSFQAFSSSNAPIGSGTNVLPFDATNFNVGSHYNTSTYRFTAPVAGVYLFSVNLNLYTAPGVMMPGVRINGSSTNFGSRLSGNINGDNNLNLIVLLSLSVNDYVEALSATQGSSANISNGASWTRFEGRLLG